MRLHGKAHGKELREQPHARVRVLRNAAHRKGGGAPRHGHVDEHLVGGMGVEGAAAIGFSPKSRLAKVAGSTFTTTSAPPRGE